MRDRTRSVVFLAPRGLGHHFDGVPDRLSERGWKCQLETLQPSSPVRVSDGMAGDAAVLVHAESVRARAASIRLAAERAGVPVVLLMDGVLEYANTFLNPGAGTKFLRPAPGDVVLAAGVHDASILAALGNRAIGTGLPRLAAFRSRAIIAQAGMEPCGILVATANTPSFTIGGRARVLESLRRLRLAIAKRHLPVRWRIAPELASDLGVERDLAPLAESVAWARAVVTTASTLAFEAMIAGRPTAIVHPHPWPLWLPTAWVHRGDSFDGFDEDVERMRALEGADRAACDAAARSLLLIRAGQEPYESVSAGDLLDSLLSPTAALVSLQNRARDAGCHPQATNRVRRVLACIAAAGRTKQQVPENEREQRQLRSKIARGAESPLALAASGTTETPKRTGTIRIVSCIESHASSVGGVAAWSGRMERFFLDHPEMGVDWRTLFVTADDPPEHERVHTRTHAGACRIDPTDDPDRQARVVAAALRMLNADVAVPNYSEVSYKACEQLRASGLLRTIAVAHTNDRMYRDLLSGCNAWDAAVAVSEACADWLRPIAGDRPMIVAPCGVPMPASRSERSISGSLRLAYVGRVVEPQKRVSDLVPLLVELDRLGVEYEFDLVGDGDALSDWQRQVARAGVKGRVRVHGSRPLDWVESLWRGIDVHVMVSEAEGMSVSMLESMAAGVVPCVTEVDNVVSTVVRDGENGIVSPVGDMAEMARKLAALARDRRELHRRSVRSRNTVLEQGLTLDVCAGAWLSLIKRVAGSPLAPIAPPLAREGIREEKGIAGSGFDADELPTLEAFEAFVRAGKRRVAVWADPDTSLRLLERLAEGGEKYRLVFVHPSAVSLSTVLGVRCRTPEAAQTEGIDALVLSNRSGSLSSFAATAKIRWSGVPAAPVPAGTGVVDQVESVCRDVERVLGRGGLVLTTAEEGVFGRAMPFLRGAKHEAPPRLLVLRGDEVDFEIYRETAPLRLGGTVVRSLRFSDAELSSPERFASIVAGLDRAERYAVYGAGTHTRRLLVYSGVSRAPNLILDDRDEPGREVCGVPIVTMRSRRENPPEVLILSSPSHEAAMWNRTAEWRSRGVRVIRMYDAAPSMAVTPTFNR